VIKEKLDKPVELIELMAELAGYKNGEEREYPGATIYNWTSVWKSVEVNKGDLDQLHLMIETTLVQNELAKNIQAIGQRIVKAFSVNDSQYGFLTNSRWRTFSKDEVVEYLEGSSASFLANMPELKASPVKKLNSHFNLRSGRRNCELRGVLKAFDVDSLKEIEDKKIFEISASTRLIEQLGVHGKLFTNRPVFDAADAERLYALMLRWSAIYYAEAQKGNNTPIFKNPYNFLKGKYCACVQYECPCHHMIEYKPDLVVMTHVDYYLNDKFIPAALSLGMRILVVTHLFSPFYKSGTYKDGVSLEAEWWRKDGLINFKVDNDKIYKHREHFNYMWDRKEHAGKGYLIKKLIEFDYGTFTQVALLIEPLYTNIPLKYLNDFKLVADFEELLNYIPTPITESSLLMDKILSPINPSKVYDYGNVQLVEKEDAGDKLTAIRTIEGTIEFAEFQRKDLTLWQIITRTGKKHYTNSYLREYLGLHCFAPEHLQLSISVANFNRLVSDLLLLDELNEEEILVTIADMLQGTCKYAANALAPVLILKSVASEVNRLRSGIKHILKSETKKQLDNVVAGSATNKKKISFKVKKYIGSQNNQPRKIEEIDDLKNSQSTLKGPKPMPLKQEVPIYGFTEREKEPIPVYGGIKLEDEVEAIHQFVMNEDKENRCVAITLSSLTINLAQLEEIPKITSTEEWIDLAEQTAEAIGLGELAQAIESASSAMPNLSSLREILEVFFEDIQLSTDTGTREKPLGNVIFCIGNHCGLNIGGLLI
jgi:hypothetical protein